MSINLDLIRKSFNAVKPHADEFVDHFYETLFTDHPEAKDLFANVNMAMQKKALINGLVHIVEYAHETNHLVDYLTKMGARHYKYAVEDIHFEWVGSALLSTFAYYFDEQWTDELKGEWVKVYTLIADTMKAGAHKAKEKAPKPQPALEDLAREMAKQLFKKALEEQVNDTFAEMAQEKVREVLRRALEKEVHAVMSSIGKKAA